MPRKPVAQDLASLRVPTDVRLSPDGKVAAFVVKASSPTLDGYRTAIWSVPSDGSEPARQITLGARHDAAPRWSPDGRWLAFLSDRGAVLRAGGAARNKADLRHTAAEGRGLKDATGRDIERGRMQVWLLPSAGGEAHQLTDLPDDVGELAWSPDSQRLCVVSAARSASAEDRPPEVASPPRRDVRLIDELDYQLNGVGFIHDGAPKLWVIDVASGAARRLTSGARPDEQPAWSPDGRRIAFVSDRGPNADLVWRSDIYVVDAAGGAPTRVSGGRPSKLCPRASW